MEPTQLGTLRSVIQNPAPTWKVNYENQNGDIAEGYFPIMGQGTVIISPLKPCEGEHISQPNQNFIALDNFSPVTIQLTVDALVGAKNYTIKITEKDVEFFLSDPNVGAQKIHAMPCGDGTTALQQVNSIRWVTLDSKNGTLIYGQGEVRWETRLFYIKFKSRNPKKPGDDDTTLAWQHHLRNIRVEGLGDRRHLIVLRDAIYGETPLIVVPENQLTLMMADNFHQTIPANLTEECQQLYHNVAGDNIVLNDASFPKFSQAIQESINNPEGWAYKKLAEKPKDFGYLRITFGLDVGNSPGNPYVVEIWPSGHFSPIHNHSGANAIIRVLYGEISVLLFSYFSTENKQEFAKKNFKAGEVTFITPDLNQTHQLKNETKDVCITFQCYLYNKKDHNHYEYFDYINSETNTIGHFDPDSDSGFTDFKILMAEEWNKNHPSEPVEVPRKRPDPLYRPNHH